MQITRILYLKQKKFLLPQTLRLPRALSWAHAAREAAKRGTILLFEAKFRRKSNKHVTKSIDGQERMQRSERRSFGPVGRKQ